MALPSSSALPSMQKSADTRFDAEDDGEAIGETVDEFITRLLLKPVCAAVVDGDNQKRRHVQMHAPSSVVSSQRHEVKNGRKEDVWNQMKLTLLKDLTSLRQQREMLIAKSSLGRVAVAAVKTPSSRNHGTDRPSGPSHIMPIFERCVTCLNNAASQLPAAKKNAVLSAVSAYTEAMAMLDSTFNSKKLPESTTNDTHSDLHEQLRSVRRAIAEEESRRQTLTDDELQMNEELTRLRGYWGRYGRANFAVVARDDLPWPSSTRKEQPSTDQITPVTNSSHAKTTVKANYPSKASYETRLHLCQNEAIRLQLQLDAIQRTRTELCVGKRGFDKLQAIIDKQEKTLLQLRHQLDSATNSAQ